MSKSVPTVWSWHTLTHYNPDNELCLTSHATNEVDSVDDLLHALHAIMHRVIKQ